MGCSLRRWLAIVVTCVLMVSAVSVAHADATADYNLALQFYKQKRWQLAAETFREFLANYPQHARTDYARLYLGQALVQLGEYEDARETFREFLEAAPDHNDRPLAMYRIGEASYFLNDYDSARRELTAFLERYPDHALAEWSRQYLGETELDAGHFRAAAGHFQRLLTQFPNSRLTTEAKFGLARASEQLGSREQAARLYRELAASGGSGRADDAQFSLGAMLFDAGEFEAAREAFEQLVREMPDSPLVPVGRLNAGYAAYRQRDFSAAQEHFEAAANEPTQRDVARYWLALTHKSLEHYEQALALLRELAETDLADRLAADVAFHLADTELRTDQPARAAEQFVRLLEEHPGSTWTADALHLGTEAALRAENHKLAQQLDERFQREFPDHELAARQTLLRARTRLAVAATLPAGEAFTAQEQAAASLEQLIETTDDAEVRDLARVQLARAYRFLDQYEKAAEALNPLVQEVLADPVNTHPLVEVLVQQAENAYQLGEIEETVRLSKAYLTRAPSGPQAANAWSTLARTQARLGDWQQVSYAIDSFREAEVTAPEVERLTYDVAEIAFEKTAWEQAAEWFEQVVEAENEELHSGALSGLAYSRYELGAFDAAAQTFARLQAVATEDPVVASNAAYMHGLALQASGEKEQAAEVLEQAGETYIPAGDVATLEEADLPIVQNGYRALKVAARLRRELGQIDRADEDYQDAYDALQLLPEQRTQEVDKLINEWALLSYENERFARSDDLFRKLVNEAPESPFADDARLYLAESDFFAGRKEAAQTAFVKLVEDSSADEVVRHRSLLLLIDLAAEQEDWKAARNYTEKFLELFPSSSNVPYARFRNAEALLQLGEPEAARDILQRLLEQRDDPQIGEESWYPSVWMLLAEAQLRLKNYEAVEATVAQFREERPDSPLLYQADEILGRSFKNRAMFQQAREAFQRVLDSEHARRTQTAAKAQFQIAETHLIQKNYKEALKAYYNVYVNYAFPEWQAPALLQAAVSDEALNDIPGAITTLETLIEEFPDSSFAEEAQARLQRLRKLESQNRPAPP